MGFATRTLRDTVVNAAGAGGTVTILVNIEDDTTANNAILDALKSVSLSDLLNPEEFLKTQNTDTAVLHT